MNHRSWIVGAAPLLLAGGYAALTLALCRPDPMEFGLFLWDYAASLGPVWLMAGLGALAVAMIRSERSGAAQSAEAIVRRFARDQWRHDRGLSAVAPFPAVVLLLASYNLYKQFYLPKAGFWFGRFAAHADRALFGRDAWQITHAIAPSPWTTQAIDLAYHSWFLPMVLGVTLCSFVQPRAMLAKRYLLSYMLLWIVQGSFLAYLLPAAGPCFYDTFHADQTRFAPLNHLLAHQDLFLRLHGAPGLYSTFYQHGLVTLFGKGMMAIGGGISAMPSMHNAMAVLFACAAWSLGRRTGIAASLYAGLIWFGSVHLGWHYAVDGIAACPLTIATWIAVGRLLSLLERMPVAEIAGSRAAPDPSRALA